MRQIVIALRNSASVIQPRRDTTISRDHAESPPPKLDNAISLKVTASCHAGTFGSSPSCAAGSAALPSTTWGEMSFMRSPSSGRSLVNQFGIVGVIVFLDQMHAQRIWRIVMRAVVPVLLEDRLQPLDDLLVVHQAAEFAAEVEGTAVDVHRAGEHALAISQQQLGMQAELLLLADLDAVQLHEP